MNSKNILCLIILFSALFSCKNKSINPDGKGDVFKVELEIKIRKDEDLILYYKDGKNDWFVDQKAIWVSLNGSENYQKVIFNLPNNILPNDLRLDIGRNKFKNQEPIEIRKLVLIYYENKFEISSKEFNRFFSGNQFIKYDEIYKYYVLDKDEQGNYDPFFETKAEFFPELIKLIKK
uniref:hypothetical protein n=1 Tax=Flavobacterium sp. TaxID=239 RepID=UPI00404AD860